MAMKYQRLTTPLVRENGAFRTATWDEALDRAAAGFRRNIDRHGGDATGIFSCSKASNEMNFLAAKARPGGVRDAQHRQLQPDLTRPQRRRSGDGVRRRWRDQLLPRGGRD